MLAFVHDLSASAYNEPPPMEQHDTYKTNIVSFTYVKSVACGRKMIPSVSDSTDESVEDG
jgi:hypothetical protein